MSHFALPDFAVIIPHYNDTTRLIRCLKALATQNRTGVEVIVADNGSDADLAPIVAQFDWVRLVHEPAKGAAAARNCGVAQTRAAWLFFLDADCVPADDWLAVARAQAAQDARRITGGAVDVFDETPPPRSGAEAFETVFAFDQQSYISQKGFSVTANLLVARATFEAVGPFSPSVSEDFEWCRRAVATGFDLRYAPQLRVSHPTRSDWPALARKWRRLTGESFGLLGGSGAGGKLHWSLRALAMPLSALAHLPKVLTHPALSGREKIRATGTLFKLRLTRMVWMLALLGR